MWLRAFLFVAALLALVAVLHWQFPYALQEQDERNQALFYIALLAAFAAAGVRTGHRALKPALRDALLWVVIVLVALAGYAYRDVFLNNRIIAALIPNRPVVGVGGTLVFYAGQNGHFYAEVHVNGTPVQFMVDTGASDIVLNQRDAERIGLKPDTLQYTRPYRTANGMTSGAPVVLDSLRIGTLEARRLPASVNKGELDTSLLGMQFLQLLGSVHIEGDALTLTPRNKR